VPSKRFIGRQYRAANASKSASEEQGKKTPSQPSSPLNGSCPTRNLVVEVVIPSYSKEPHRKAYSSSVEDSDEEAVRQRPSRRSKKSKYIVISDDEGEDSASEYDETDATKSNQIADSEDDDTLGIEDDSDMSDERPKAKTKAKPKPMPKANAVKKLHKVQSSDDHMDVDEIPSKAQQGKKRKSEVMSTDVEEEDEDGKSMKKVKKETKPKISRAAADPWKLKSSSVRKTWKQMQAPPLEMFHFHRLVIDEYTYLDGKTHSLITSLQATCRWVLSGTPPVHDFPSLKTIAVFLDVHLGIDDDGEGQSAQVKKRRREQTGKSFLSAILLISDQTSTEVEKFHSFREVRSLEWHAHRHQVGQGFLDQFVRQVRHAVGNWR
jgi:hypothetical protein